jgi:hypothetical protein
VINTLLYQSAGSKGIPTRQGVLSRCGEVRAALVCIFSPRFQLGGLFLDDEAMGKIGHIPICGREAFLCEKEHRQISAMHSKALYQGIANGIWITLVRQSLQKIVRRAEHPPFVSHMKQNVVFTLGKHLPSPPFLDIISLRRKLLRHRAVSELWQK